MHKFMRKKLSIKEISSWSTSVLSRRILLCIIGVIAVVFALFFLVGFDRPFEDDANYRAPLFTDLLLWFIYLMVLVALALTVWSLVLQTKKRKREQQMVNGIHAGKINRYTFLSVFGLLVVTFLFGSSEPIIINGHQFDSFFWLKATDMFIYTSFIMVFVAIAVSFVIKYRQMKHDQLKKNK